VSVWRSLCSLAVVSELEHEEVDAVQMRVAKRGNWAFTERKAPLTINQLAGRPRRISKPTQYDLAQAESSEYSRGLPKR
jgi:hypothetical protein